MKKIFLGFMVFLLFGTGISNTLAQRVPVLEFFHGEECPYCQKERKWFPELMKLYPDLQIKKYEVWSNSENNQLLQERMRELGTTSNGVPTNIIAGTDVIVGFLPDEILASLEKHFGPPATEKSNIYIPEAKDTSWKKYLKSSWPIMSLVLGLLDGFNPCAMWTLLILLGFLIAMEDKKRRWLVGLVFVGSSALIYFLALLAYLLGFESIIMIAGGNTMGWVFQIVGLFALITGVIALKSAFQKKVDCDVRDGASKAQFKNKLTKILERDKIYLVLAGVIGLAFSVNMLELLCSFAIPTAFTGTLIALDLPFWQQITAITLYDIMYILDDILVLVIALWTMNLKVLSDKVVQYSHFIGGLLLLIIGAFLLFDSGALTSLAS